MFRLPGFDKSQWLVFILLQHDTQFIFLDELFGSAERLPQWTVQPLPLWKRSVEKLDQKPIISDLSKCAPIKNRLSYKVRNPWVFLFTDHERLWMQLVSVYLSFERGICGLHFYHWNINSCNNNLYVATYFVCFPRKESFLNHLCLNWSRLRCSHLHRNRGNKTIQISRWKMSELQWRIMIMLLESSIYTETLILKISVAFKHDSYVTFLRH